MCYSEAECLGVARGAYAEILPSLPDPDNAGVGKQHEENF